jgi:transposase
MEACATAHDRGRAIKGLSHTVRLLPPSYVKPFIKRHKNDAADAEAITEGAMIEFGDGVDAPSRRHRDVPRVADRR